MILHVSLNELKDYAGFDLFDQEYDTQLARALSAAHITVTQFLNRRIYTTPFDPSKDSDLEVNDEIKFAILEIANHRFENKGYIKEDVTNSMLYALIGSYRLPG